MNPIVRYLLLIFGLFFIANGLSVSIYGANTAAASAIYAGVVIFLYLLVGVGIVGLFVYAGRFILEKLRLRL